MKPFVSIIIPCYNEQATIGLLLSAIACQTYPLPAMEVIVADGLSSDRTRIVITGFQQEHPDLLVSIIDNPKRIIPAALNVALSAAKGKMIIRLDGHSIPQSDYVERSVRALEMGLGDVVGGVWEIRPGGPGWMSQAIAAVAAHPLGVGDARYRYTTTAGVTDTVPFGAFKRELIDRIGNFNEALQANEDYEFNTRVRLYGGKVWLDPAIRSVYFARSTIGGLTHQYWNYGYWKARMLKRYPGTLRWRQAIPPVFVASLVVLALLAPWLLVARVALVFELFLYLLALLAAGTQLAFRKQKISFLGGVPLAIAAMHLSWGTGFLWSLIPHS